MVTKQSYIHSSLNVVLWFPLHIHDHVENIPKHVLFYVHDVKIIAEEIGLPIRKLLENTLLYRIVVKPGNFCLLDWKLNTMSPYSDTTSYNSSFERCSGATTFLTLPIKNSFLFFLYL
jgi:hypothetical protein